MCGSVAAASSAHVEWALDSNTVRKIQRWTWSSGPRNGRSKHCPSIWHHTLVFGQPAFAQEEALFIRYDSTMKIKRELKISSLQRWYLARSRSWTHAGVFIPVVYSRRHTGEKPIYHHCKDEVFGYNFASFSSSNGCPKKNFYYKDVSYCYS